MYHYITSRTGGYNILKEYAHKNRKNMTQAESVMWECLRGNKLGYRFRRQHPIQGFIADFVCLPLYLIIEIDGGYHNEPEQTLLDEERETILIKQGYSIIRFSNDEVLMNTKQVLEIIKNNMKYQEELVRDSSPLLGRGRGRLLIFSAPSGSGKSTIINWLMAEHPELLMHFSISCTSRAPRGQEQNGVEYFFLSPDEFRQKIANDEFVEYEEVFKDQFYGTLKAQVEKQRAEGQVVFDVDVHGAMNLKKYFGDDAMSIFIMPPSVEEVRKRLQGRGTETAEQIEKRVSRAEYEMSFADKFDTIVINDDLEIAKAEALDKIKVFIG